MLDDGPLTRAPDNALALDLDLDLDTMTMTMHSM